MSRVAIVAALPREIAALVRGTKPDAGLLRQGIHLHEIGSAVVVAGGMGATRVTRAVQAALARADVAMLVSVGLAGACSAEVAAGSLVEAGEVVDALTGERFATESAGPVLATIGAIASVQEKARLLAAYGAAAVDMEAATVGRLARAHGLTFRAVKGISDAHDFELAALERFTGKHGHFRTRAFALHTALRPHRWTKTAKLGRDSGRALAAMTAALQVDLRER